VKFEKILTLLVLCAFLIVLSGIIDNLVPWYKIHNIEVLGDSFAPGDGQKILLDRSAMISFKATVTRELVRRSSDYNEEVWKISYSTPVNKGKRKIFMNWELPNDCDNCPYTTEGTYFWRGIATFKPMGFSEVTVPFETNEFKIVKSPTVEVFIPPK